MLKSFVNQYPKIDSRKPKLLLTMATGHFDNKVTESLLCYWVLEEKYCLPQKAETGKSHYRSKIHLHWY